MLQVSGNQMNDSSNFELKLIQGCLHDSINSHPNDINLKFSSSIVSLILMKAKHPTPSNDKCSLVSMTR